MQEGQVLCRCKKYFISLGRPMCGHCERVAQQVEKRYVVYPTSGTRQAAPNAATGRMG